VANHPNRSKKNPDRPGRTPRPAEILAAREAANLTQEAAAKLIYKSKRAWEKWEYGERSMDPAFWEFWKIKLAESRDSG
jgi:putative transcriptional regulator